MKLVKSILTRNPCVSNNPNRKIHVKGLMLHSVGCPQPDAKVFVRNWNSPAKTGACVHAFVDGNDGTVYQTLEWGHRGWHGGGSSNNTHIGVEMCEPACIRYLSGSKFVVSDMAEAQACARRTYMASVELFAMLCQAFWLDPMKSGVIVSHKEGHERGIATNHGDPEHLWTQLGMPYTMDTFRAAVRDKIGGSAVSDPAPKPVPASGKPCTTMTERQIWDWLKSQGLTDEGVAGIMGNLYAESGLHFDNLQNTGNNAMNMSDAMFTAMVDTGKYSADKFVRDGYGYGIAQWTYHTRKQGLYDAARKAGTSIADAGVQLRFLMSELSSEYKPLLAKLRNVSTTVRQASDAVLLDFERPARTGDSVRKQRAAHAQSYFDKYAGKMPSAKPASGTSAKPAGGAPFLARVTASALNIRAGAGTHTAITGCVRNGDVYTIVATEVVGRSVWGKLKSGKGWICLDYTKRV